MIRLFVSPSLPVAILLTLLLQTGGCGRETELTEHLEGVRIDSLTLLFYNVENLFDTLDHPDFADEAFTPVGRMSWSSRRYDDKIRALGRAIRLASPPDGPSIVALAEVENREVVKQLLEREVATGRYEIVHSESRDVRGIDVAVAFDSSVWSKSGSAIIRPSLPGGATTRDMALVDLRHGPDTLTVIALHWPSRREGQAASEPKRIQTALMLRQVLDSIFSYSSDRDVVVVGDFNDEPENRSLREALRAVSPAELREPTDLINLASALKADTIGSYFYRGDWQILDQILVSQGMLDTRGFSAGEMSLFHPPMLRDYHPSAEGNPPRRTFIRGNLWIGGTSDHFPVMVKIYRHGSK